MTIFGKGFNFRSHLSPHMGREGRASCVKIKSEGFNPWGDTEILVGNVLESSCSPTVDDTYG